MSHPYTLDIYLIMVHEILYFIYVFIVAFMIYLIITVS